MPQIPSRLPDLSRYQYRVYHGPHFLDLPFGNPKYHSRHILFHLSIEDHRVFFHVAHLPAHFITSAEPAF